MLKWVKTRQEEVAHVDEAQSGDGERDRRPAQAGLVVWVAWERIHTGGWGML